MIPDGWIGYTPDRMGRVTIAGWLTLGACALAGIGLAYLVARWVVG